MSRERAQALQQAYRALGKRTLTADDQMALRREMRASVEAYGIRSRRKLLGRMLDRNGEDRSNMLGIGALPQGAGAAYYPVNGMTRVRRDMAHGASSLARDAEGFGERVRAAKMGGEEYHKLWKQSAGYEASIHEAVHEYGPASWTAHYKSHGGIMEEVATEAIARRITRDQLGLALGDIHSLGVPSHGRWGAYGRDIRKVVDGLNRALIDIGARSTPLAEARAYLMVERASLRFKSLDTAAVSITSTDDFIGAFAESFDFDEFEEILDAKLSSAQRRDMARAIAKQITQAFLEL